MTARVTRRRLGAQIGLGMVALIATCRAARADNFPSRPIKFVCPYTAGGPGDTTLRLLAEAMSKELGQPIVVENRPGGNGAVAGNAVVAAPPDGYTVLQTVTSTLVLAPLQSNQAGYASKLTGVGYLLDAPLGVVAKPQLDAKSLRDVIALATARPKQLNYGFAGIGSIGHLLAEDFCLREGIDMVGVPYPGDTAVINALMAGDIDLAFVALPGALPFIKSGKVTGLVTTGRERLAELPSLPTAAEAGYPALEATTFYGLSVTKGTPPEILGRLSNAFIAACRDPRLQERLKEMYFRRVGRGPDDLNAEAMRQHERWLPIIRKLGLEPKD
jgi:tripartite-type tricarboxylate transporter receptor subunit TctC